MESKGKKAYSTPELVIHGDVEKLTQEGGGLIADQPIGIGDAIGTNNTGS